MLRERVHSMSLATDRPEASVGFVEIREGERHQRGRNAFAFVSPGSERIVSARLAEKKGKGQRMPTHESAAVDSIVDTRIIRRYREGSPPRGDIMHARRSAY